METERRLRVLEADLQAAEVAKKERTIAIRYHKIKFFGVCNIPRISNFCLILYRTTKSYPKDQAGAESSETRADKVREKETYPRTSGTTHKS